MDTVATKLKAIAAELREHPFRLTKGAFARTAGGSPIGPDRENACAWCSLGFVQREFPESRAVRELAYNLLDKAVGGYVEKWNDAPDRTAHQVADAFDRAAELASQTAGAAS